MVSNERTTRLFLHLTIIIFFSGHAVAMEVFSDGFEDIICDGSDTSLTTWCAEDFNGEYSCDGIKRCTVSGWGPCEMPAELCDGMDNDCDGVADNDVDCSGIGSCLSPYEIDSANGPYAFDFSQAASDISLSDGGCTGSSTSGPEIVTAITFPAASTVTFNYYSDGDASIYIVSDCGIPQESCLAGSDNQIGTGIGGMESLQYTFSADETVYVILDNYDPHYDVTEGYLEIISN